MDALTGEWFNKVVPKKGAAVRSPTSREDLGMASGQRRESLPQWTPWSLPTSIVLT